MGGQTDLQASLLKAMYPAFHFRFVRKLSAPILVNAGVEGNMKQQQQLSWYVLKKKEQISLGKYVK